MIYNIVKSFVDKNIKIPSRLYKQYFCLNYVNQKIIPYYVKWGLIHLGIIKNTPILTIYSPVSYDFTLII